jgi:hypothetical protein
MQRLFDGPTANESCAARLTSTVAMQPLFLLNSDFMSARAASLAARVRRESGDESAAQIDAAFRLALCRPPDDDERRFAEQFLAASDVGDDPLAQLCLALFSLNEFAYVD